MGNSVGGFKSSPANLPGRRGKATRGAQRRTEGRGVMAPRRPRSRPTMNANDDSSRSRESVSDASIDYEKLAQTLLSRELERHAYDIRVVFMAASAAVERGDGLDAADLRDLEGELERAQFFLDELREAME